MLTQGEDVSKATVTTELLMETMLGVVTDFAGDTASPRLR